MSVEQKLSRLGEQAVFDISCACGFDPARQRGVHGRWIYPTAMPDGTRKRTLKVLQDNACQNDCAFCAQRAGRDTPRDRFTPDELAGLFDRLTRTRMVETLFLSSGLGGDTVRSMDRMIATVEIIRRRYRYRGFIHLKILPGAQRAQVERAAQLAQRISINLEAPGAERLRALSCVKDFEGDILERMRWISELVQDRRFLAKGHTTQFVVGAAGETDAEIVSTAGRLYREHRLSRAYYSKFAPVPGTPLEHMTPAPFLREHRLYQVDFLLRKYGFSSEEIPYDPEGHLSTSQDPKTHWARLHPERFPLEINRAEKEELLRVPGLGPVSVKRILDARREGRILDVADLGKLGAVVRRASPYLLLSGKPADRQLSFLQEPCYDLPLETKR